MATTPDMREDWGSGWQNRWYVPQSASMDKVKQQGLRIPYNVEVVGSGNQKVLRVHVRRSDKDYVVGGTTIPKGSYSAGMAQHRMPNHFYRGRWSFRVRMTVGRGGRKVALLWPGDGAPGWPKGGELDAPENGDDRFNLKGTAIALHYADSSGAHKQSVKAVAADLTKWIQVDYRWGKSSLRIQHNGKTVVTFTDHLPPDVMKLCIQTATADGGVGNTFTDGSGKTIQRSASYLEVGPISYWENPDAL